MQSVGSQGYIAAFQNHNAVGLETKSTETKTVVWGVIVVCDRNFTPVLT